MTPRQPPKANRLRQTSPARPVTPARKAAFEILTSVSAGKGHSDDLLHSAHCAGLSPDDRNLTTAIVMGVLRWQIALDAQISRLLARPDQKPADPISIVLRMGAFQLLHMDRIPAHAALSESVELCRAAGQPHATGMVNAILRKVAVNKLPPKPIFESTALFAQRLGHPQWLVERWVAQYGAAAALAVCEYDQQIPAAGGIFASDLQTGGPEEPQSATVESLPHIDDGSRLVAELTAVAMPETPHAARVWDCCAAPGGKTLILSERLPHADILATDVSFRRVQHMESGFRGTLAGTRIRTAIADASASSLQLSPSGGAAQFDLILCDVPCTGTGTLARNPEIRHRLRPAELLRQTERQRAILTNALCHLAPGGRLVYSTCSLEPEENEALIEAAVPRELYHQVPVGPLIASLAGQGMLQPGAGELLTQSALSGDCLRTLPGTHPCDGFFASVIERL